MGAYLGGRFFEWAFALAKMLNIRPCVDIRVGLFLNEYGIPIQNLRDHSLNHGEEI